MVLNRVKLLVRMDVNSVSYQYDANLFVFMWSYVENTLT